ncbi:hypothetical protein SAMN05880582_1011334 [Rhizobium sp. RU20A]|uniref:DUF2076 domain-containing protein n=1 Tax=Rhizobium sp. RU20A TaxID=1907412 RepID=UPI0009540FFC|nr:DUF2076 domain-containing protein [Rhizobium sp. RU20A]SIQ27474.1 hypothetical protein SAMN05880582_1011334 [Rhizobium sp. RU20A]
MSPEERQLLTALFDRVRTASATPRDREAEALIADEIRTEPAAPYYLAQAVIVQEKGLEAAGNHIRELEARIRDLEAAQAETPAPASQGGFLASIFGSRREPDTDRSPRQPDPYGQNVRPQQPGTWGNGADRPGAAAPAWAAQQRHPDPNAYGGNAGPAVSGPFAGGPWSRQQAAPSAGSSFLSGAATTAAGVAGGMLLANGLSHIFGSQFGGLGWGNPAAMGQPIVEETVVNNYYDKDPNQQDATQQNDPQQDDGGWQTAEADPGDSGYDTADYGGGDFGSDSFDV